MPYKACCLRQAVKLEEKSTTTTGETSAEVNERELLTFSTK